MKNTIFLVTLFLLVIVSYQDVYSQKTLANSKVEIEGSLSSIENNHFTINFKLKNLSDSAIYISTNPTQINGKKGYYIQLDETEDAKIKVESRVYPPLLYSPYSNETGVELKRIEVGETFDGIVKLKTPLEETIPPSENPFKLKKLSNNDFEKIALVIGYFIEEEGIINFLKTKKFGWWIKGYEIISSGIHKGKRFYEIQNLITADLSFSAQINEKKIIQCKIKSKELKSVKYHVGSIERVEETLSIHVAVKTNQINEKDLVSIVKHLKERFCNETRLVIGIFDNERTANNFNPIFKDAWESLRGEYVLDKAKGEEFIIFVKTPGYFGNSKDVVRLNLINNNEN